MRRSWLKRGGSRESPNPNSDPNPNSNPNPDSRRPKGGALPVEPPVEVREVEEVPYGADYAREEPYEEGAQEEDLLIIDPYKSV